MWWAAAGLGVSGLGALGSFVSTQLSADQMRADTREQVRRLELQQKQVLGEATARGAASGVEFGSASLSTYLDAMTQEFKREAEWARETGYRAANATAASGALRLGSDVAGSLFQYGAANNWWRQPAAPAGGASYTPGLGGPLWR
jgi:hypothetical protein